MKSKVLIPCMALLLFMAVSTKAQNTFSMVYYNSTDDVYGYSLARTSDNGYLVAGNKDSNGLLFKIDSTGALQWSKEFNFGNNTLFTRIISTNDSCFVICGGIETSGPSDLLCMKVTSGGDTVWTKKFSALLNLFAFSVTQTYDDGYLITGTVGNSSAPYFKSLLLKLDFLGNHEWNEILTTGTAANYGYDVKQAPDSEFVFMGYIESGLTGSTYIFIMSPTGTIRWSRKYSDSLSMVLGAGIVAVPDGYACLMIKDFDYELMKIDLTGNIVFLKSYGNLSFGVCGGCVQPRFQATRDLGYILITGTDPRYSGFGDRLIKVDSLGDLQWMQDVSMSLADICVNSDNGFTLAGNGPLIGVRGMSTTTNPQIGVIRTDSLGNNSTCNYPNTITVTVDSLTVSVFAFNDSVYGNAADLFPTITSSNLVSDSGCVAFVGGITEINAENFIHLYPNPALSRINFSFAKNARLYKLSIFNVLGEEVYAKSLTGEETRNFSLANTFPPGMYMAVIRDDRFVYSKKMVIE